TPRERDPALRDPRLWPRDWVALCDGDAVRPEDAREIALLHTRTGRRVRIRLPGLRGYRIVGFSDGLLVLLRKSTTALRVLHPLTLVAVDFPSLATVYHEEVADMGSLRDMKAAVCSSSSSREPSTSSIAAVVLFPNANGNVVVAADGGKDHWEVLHRRHEKLSIRNTLLFQGRLYATTFHPPSPEIVQLYPPGPTLDNMVATVPGAVRYSRYSDTLHLVESAGRMLLVVRHVIVRASTTKRQLLTFAIYSVDFDDEDNNGRPTLTPVSGLGDRALFLGDGGCLSVSARGLPSLSSDSIYFSTPFYPLQVRSVAAADPGRWRRSEELATQRQIHDRKERIRPSVRPFTIADHLLTFCHPREWTKGLMFHEYHVIPESFKELRKKIRAKDSAAAGSTHPQQYQVS
uniref:KIB1-4 beta-propeller domain-containing protein n=1 Tax=Aegilops tauschii subsp. strangulata TaxID=200361 RepID=A0A453E517_AEGTS